MPVSDETILEAELAIAAVPGLAMDADDLVEDAHLLALSFPDEDEFKAAAASTVRAIRNLAAGNVTSASLKYAFEGWLSFHYQHRVAQRNRANCRIVFRETENGIEVKGFGHRSIPADLYARMSETRLAPR